MEVRIRDNLGFKKKKKIKGILGVLVNFIKQNFVFSYSFQFWGNENLGFEGNREE
jgi:hypothetical protein